MESDASYKIRWRRASLAVLFGMLLCAAFALVACGGTTSQSSSSASSSSATSSSSASSSAASSSEASQSSAGQQLSAAYCPVKIVANYNNGSTQTSVNTLDDRGRQLESDLEFSSSEGTYKVNDTATEWDDYGHYTKVDEVCDFGDGKPFSVSLKTTAIDVNKSGFVSSIEYALTTNKDNFGEGEAASEKRSETVEYGEDAAIIRKHVTVSEQYDKSGKLIATLTKTLEFDESGLQTLLTERLVDASGAESNATINITWTKDENGKPVSYQTTENIDGENTTSSGDVTLNEQGLVTAIGNVKVNDEARSTNIEITYEKIDNPMQNGYEGWKNITLTDVLFSAF